VTSGTIFDKTRTPLKVWLAAAWCITSQKSGISALGLQRDLGWAGTRQHGPCCTVSDGPWVRPGREQLKGLVEVDQSYLAIRENRESVTSSALDSLSAPKPCGGSQAAPGI
jgi:hypothetical protein